MKIRRRRLRGYRRCRKHGRGAWEGRQERGWTRPGGVRSRMSRSPKHSAATLWLCPVAPPCPLPAVRRKLQVALGCAPGFSAEYQGLLTILPKPPPGRVHPLSWLFLACVTKIGSSWFILYENSWDCVILYYCMVGFVRCSVSVTANISFVCFTVNIRKLAGRWN